MIPDHLECSRRAGISNIRKAVEERYETPRVYEDQIKPLSSTSVYNRNEMIRTNETVTRNNE